MSVFCVQEPINVGSFPWLAFVWCHQGLNILLCRCSHGSVLQGGRQRSSKTDEGRASSGSLWEKSSFLPSNPCFSTCVWLCSPRERQSLASVPHRFHLMCGATQRSRAQHVRRRHTYLAVLLLVTEEQETTGQGSHSFKAIKRKYFPINTYSGTSTTEVKVSLWN